MNTNTESVDNDVGSGLDASTSGKFHTILVERHGRVGLVTLNRPKSLNALNGEMAVEILAALRNFDSDDGIGATVITGNSRAFAAGADIAEMARVDFSDFWVKDFLNPWDQIKFIKKPVVAAVGGYALGGGCELAMLCDFIIASEDAKFGQPEVTLGIPPGIGASQRLTRAAGKSVAMDMILTGRIIDATEAKSIGLISRIVHSRDLVVTAIEIAQSIASYNAPAIKLAKEAVNIALELPLGEGLRHERLLFQTTFATEGQKEGMNAFVAKRPPVFRHR